MITRFFKATMVMTTLLFAGLSAHAQKPFAHSESIDSSYFDPSLAPFYHGVASGDPLQDRVIIWTRITPTKDTIIPVKWWIATDTGFTNIVNSGHTTTDYTKDYTVKIDVDKLEPGNTYFYYFQALGANSLIGRTRTLPTNTEHVRLGVVSCSNYQAGYFNGYRRLAEREDLDAILHLGDYFYEYGTGGYGWSSEMDRGHKPEHEIVSRDDYRVRHSYYKLDPDLRAAHQQQVFITVWDDHEIVNDAHTTGTRTTYNHDPAIHGDYATRKFNATSAYMEWMPIREQNQTSGVRIYRQFTFGNLVDLNMVDTRLEARTAQPSGENDPHLYDTTSTILGKTQRDWLINNMENSSAKWQVIGNQVMFSEQYSGFSEDSWEGYPYERELMIEEFKNLETKNIVILTGDTHRSWAFDLTEDPLDTNLYTPTNNSNTFGVEFGTTSVSSPNSDEGSGGMSGALASQAQFLNINPHLKYVNLWAHGYLILDITPQKVQADFFYTDVKQSTNVETFAKGMYTLNEQGMLQEANAPAAEKTGDFIFAPSTPPAYTVGVNEHQHRPDVLFQGAYPNPVWNKLHVGITANSSQKITLDLVSIDGQNMFERDYNITPGHHPIELDMEHIPVGTYILNITSGNERIYQRKLIKN